MAIDFLNPAHRCGYPTFSGAPCKVAVEAAGQRCGSHTDEALRTRKPRKLICGVAQPNGKVCTRGVMNEGDRCFAHSPEGIAQAERIAVEMHARQIAEKNEQVHALKLEIDMLKRQRDDLEKELMIQGINLRAAKDKERAVWLQVEERAASLSAVEAQKHMAELLGRAREALLQPDPPPSATAYADSCRETAKEMRLFAVFLNSPAAKRTENDNATPAHEPSRIFRV